MSCRIWWVSWISEGSGKNELAFEDRLRLEEYYVRNWSIWLDFVILVKTVKVVWRGEGI